MLVLVLVLVLVLGDSPDFVFLLFEGAARHACTTDFVHTFVFFLQSHLLHVFALICAIVCAAFRAVFALFAYECSMKWPLVILAKSTNT